MRNDTNLEKPLFERLKAKNLDNNNKKLIEEYEQNYRYPKNEKMLIYLKMMVKIEKKIVIFVIKKMKKKVD